MPKRGGLEQFGDLGGGGLGKKEGGDVFEEGGGGVDTPMHTMLTPFTIQMLMEKLETFDVFYFGDLKCKIVTIALPCLSLMNMLCFACGERKIWSNIKSQNIMTMIICKIFFCFFCLC